MREGKSPDKPFAILRDRHTLPGMLAHTRLRTHCGMPEAHDFYEGWAEYAGAQASIQLLGTSASESNSFCWGWAVSGGLPDSLTWYSREFCDWMTSQTQNPVPEDGVMHYRDPGIVFVLSAIAAEHAGGGYCFDTWPLTDTLAGFFLLKYPQALPPIPVNPLCGVLQFATQNLLPHHQAPLKACLTNEGFSIEETGRHWNCEHPDGRSLTLSFDDSEYLAQLTPMGDLNDPPSSSRFDA